MEVRAGLQSQNFLALKQNQRKGGSHGACVAGDPATDSCGLDAEVQ